MIILIGFLIFHFFIAYRLIKYCYENGTMKELKEKGDGIRMARPSDLIFVLLFFWEIYAIEVIFERIEELINNNVK